MTLSSKMTPSAIKLHRRSQVLELAFGERTFELKAEYLRVFSPSAEVRGHGKDQEILQLNKQDAQILGIEPQGNYAIRITFADGHNSGIYTWDYLYQLGEHYTSNWDEYLLKAATQRTRS